MINISAKQSGKKPNLRPFSESSEQGNQWITTPRQDKFIELWLTPGSDTFGNAYKSAIKAGFSKFYAHKITAKSTGLEWVGANRSMLTSLKPEHINQSLQELAMSSPRTSDRLRALDMLAKLQGLYTHTSNRDIDITFSNNVPRPKLN